MKKNIITLLMVVCVSVVSNAQIKTNEIISQNTLTNSTAFLDASSSGLWNATEDIGKGLVFPRVDLTQLTQLKQTGPNVGTNFPTRMDGMVVYNIGEGAPAAIGGGENVTRGFYYYENETTDLQGGHWVKIGGGASAVATGVDNGEFWTLKGNVNTTPVTEADITDLAQNDFTLKPSATGKNFIGTTDAKNVMFVTGKNDGGTIKSIARLEIGEKNNETVAGTSGFNFVLDVYGKARFRDGIVTKASTYPDYVFDNYFTGKSDENPNYEFKKLNEVEKFIKENNHLPGVTSIKELTKSENGYDVDNTQLSIQTLEKVEELYLHVIEQQKEIQALKAEIAELKK